jgi:ABC-type multidrug transport system fused ATPase/permease subunit
MRSREEDWNASLDLIRQMLDSQRQDLDNLSAENLKGYRWFFNKINRLIDFKDKANIKFCNLEHVEPSLRISTTEAEIEATVKQLQRELLSQGASADTIGRARFDFSAILDRLTRRTRMLLHLWEMISWVLIYGLLLCCKGLIKCVMIQGYAFLIQKVDNLPTLDSLMMENKSNPNIFQSWLLIRQGQAEYFRFDRTRALDTVINMSVLLVFYTMYRWSTIFVQIYKGNLSIKVMNIMILLIIERIFHSEQRFIMKIDNSMTSKLFYTDFDNFPNFYGDKSALGSLIFWSIIFAVYYSESEGILPIVCYILFGIFIGLIILSIVIAYVRYPIRNNSHGERVKKLYELVLNFNSIKVKDLAWRYKSIIDKLRAVELKAIIFLSDLTIIFKNILDYYSIIFFFINSLIFKRRFMSLPTTMTDTQRVLVIFSDAANFMVFYFLIRVTEFYWLRFIDQSKGMVMLMHSQSFYRRFFMNPCYRVAELIDDDSVTVGSVRVEDCTASERSSQQIEAIIESILKQKNPQVKQQQPVQQNQESISASSKKTLLRKKRGMSENVRWGWFNQKRKKESAKLSIDIDDEVSLGRENKNLLCDELSLSIPNGKKVGLFCDKNKTRVELVKLILGDGIISRGCLRIRGKVSWLDTSSQLFLVGRTIMENITMMGDFRQDRYSSVLSLLSLSFSRYKGGDYYQIAEGAANISSFDAKLILIARFLYQEADIYIIENLFKEKRSIPSQINLASIFRDLLKDKTIIVSSQDASVLKNCDEVMLFLGNKYLKTQKAENFLTHLNITRTKNLDNSFEQEDFDEGGVSEKRRYTFQYRTVNALLIKNINFDHELKLYKKEQALKDWTQSRLKGACYIERISLGIYLGQQRRLEGNTLFTSNHHYKPSELWESIKDHLIPTKMMRIVTSILMVLLILTTAYIEVTIPYIFEHCLNIIGLKEDNDYRRPVMRRIAEILCSENAIIIAISIFTLASSFGKVLGKRILLKRTQEIHETLVNGIIEYDYKSLQCFRHHYLIGLMDTNFRELESFILDAIVDCSTHLISVVSSLIFLNMIFPLYYLVMTVFIIWSFLRKTREMLSLVMVILPINSLISEKLKNFYYAIPQNVIFARHSRTLQELKSRLCKLADNSNLVSTKISSDLICWSLVYCNILNIILMLSWLFFVLMATSGYGLSSRYSIFYYGWSLIMVYKLKIKTKAYFTNLTSLMNKSTNLITIHNFLLLQKEKNTKRQQIEMYGRRDLSYLKSDKLAAYSIIFKKVYLTLGNTIVLKDINFKIKKGEKAVFLGCDGVGRSYIINIIACIFRPDEEEHSQIWILNTKVEEYANLSETTKKIDLLDASPSLFEGTIRRNIDPTESYTDEEILKVLWYMGGRSNKSNFSIEKTIGEQMFALIEEGTSIVMEKEQLAPDKQKINRRSFNFDSQITNSLKAESLQGRLNGDSRFKKTSGQDRPYVMSARQIPLKNIPERQESEHEGTDDKFVFMQENMSYQAPPTSQPQPTVTIYEEPRESESERAYKKLREKQRRRTKELDEDKRSIRIYDSPSFKQKFNSKQEEEVDPSEAYDQKSQNLFEIKDEECTPSHQESRSQMSGSNYFFQDVKGKSLEGDEDENELAGTVMKESANKTYRFSNLNNSISPLRKTLCDAMSSKEVVIIDEGGFKQWIYEQEDSAKDAQNGFFEELSRDRTKQYNKQNTSPKLEDGSMRSVGQLNRQSMTMGPHNHLHSGSSGSFMPEYPVGTIVIRQSKKKPSSAQMYGKVPVDDTNLPNEPNEKSVSSYFSKIKQGLQSMKKIGNFLKSAPQGGRQFQQVATAQPPLSSNDRTMISARQPSISEGELLKGQSSRIRSHLFTEQDIQQYRPLLDVQVAFSGNNLDTETKRYINACRCILKQPEILLLWEESLNFGDGIDANIKRLCKELHTSTIVSVAKDSRNLFLYDQAILVDSGTIAEIGKPINLMQNKESIVYNFVKETEPDMFKHLKRQIRQYKIRQSDSVSIGMSKNSEIAINQIIFREEQEFDKGIEEFAQEKDSLDSHFKNKKELISENLKKRNRTTDGRLHSIGKPSSPFADNPPESSPRQEVAVVADPRLATCSVGEIKKPSALKFSSEPDN